MLEDVLRLRPAYDLKHIPRNSWCRYHDEKDGVTYKRRETVAEHVFSCLRLAQYFLTLPEFEGLDQLRVHELLLYHDDAEVITKDIGISMRTDREGKQEREEEAVALLTKQYPSSIGRKLESLCSEYTQHTTPEAKFATAVDKFDALLHEVPYPQDWSPHGFDEANTRAWFQPAFSYSPTFSTYFEELVLYLRANGHFGSILPE